MRICEVRTKEDEEKFFTLPVKLYQGDKSWINPLDKDIRIVFNKERNSHFKHGRLQWWILEDKAEVIGRIAAFVDDKIAADYSPKAGGFGFFECINSQAAADLLFKTSMAWLKEQKMEVADGPINFGKRNRWWGLLVEGFDLPNYGMNYNFPYYRELFENFGLQNYYEQYTFRGSLTPPPEARRNAELILSDPKYHFEHIDLKRIDHFAAMLVEVYNKAWKGHEGTPAITVEDIARNFRENKKVIDERLIWFASYEGNPVGFLVFLPEFAGVLQKLNGKLGIAEKLKFLYYRKKLVKSFVGSVFGIVPEFQGKDITSAFCVKVESLLKREKHNYQYFELNWIGDFNPKMISLVQRLGTHKVRTYITYRYMLDKTLNFQRCKKINLGSEREPS